MTNKTYTCIGENFKNDVKIGYCGDSHTLIRWLEELYPNKREELEDYFDGAPDKEVIEYIFEMKGKRLI